MRMMNVLCVLALLLPSISIGQTAGTATLTATPTSGNGVISVKLTWASTPAASSCALTGGGVSSPTVAASGSTSDSITKTTTYSLACTWTRTQNVLTWTPPTVNTDGSALTNLGSYTITWGPVGSSTDTQTTVSTPSATTYTVTPPSPGTYNYVIQACNSAGVCSLPSTSVTGPPIGSATASATATTTVTPIPQTPTNLTVN